MRRAIVLSSTLLVLTIASSAGALVATTHPGSTATTYSSPVFFHPKGETLTYANFDIDVHDIRSVASRPSNSAAYCAKSPGAPCPLFYSDVLDLGQTGSVYGSESVDSGIYDFYCTLHPWMRAKLIVG